MSAVVSLEPDAAAPSGPSLRARISALRRSRYLVAGLAILAVFVLTGVLGPLFIQNPNAFSSSSIAPPSLSHWLGTTQTGQDVFAQLVASTRGTLVVGFTAAIIATVVSVTVGIGGALRGGIVDDALSLLSNVFLVIPQLPLVIVIAAFVKGSGAWSTILVIGLTSWAASARILRAQTLSVRTRDYVLAARAGGEPGWRVAVTDVIPNELPIIASQFIYAAITAVLTQAGLAFLGLAALSQLTWGNMLYFAQNDAALDSGAWWWFIPPGLCIGVLGAALAMVNFGLDEVLNPRLRLYREPKAGRTERRAARRMAGDTAGPGAEHEIEHGIEHGADPAASVSDDGEGPGR